MRLSLLLALLVCASAANAGGYAACGKYRLTVQREMNLAFGAQASAPTFGGLLFQESRCNPLAVNKNDGGAGLVQLTGEANIQWISQALGEKINPYDSTQAIKAGVWLLKWSYSRVQGADACQTMGAALSAYNGGIKWVLHSQSKSSNPRIWFGLSELIPSGQLASNQEFSRSYPRKILKHSRVSPMREWGSPLCLTILGG